MSKHPIVASCEFSKTLLGHWRLDFQCPSCQAALNSKESAARSVDDCPNCGMQFVFSQSVVNQLETLMAAERLEKQAKQEETEKRKQETDKQRRRREKVREEARREQEAEARRREDERGYDYPNLRKYQTYLEATAFFGAILSGLMGAAALVVAFLPAWGGGSTIAVVSGIASAAISCMIAASWYFGWMVAAEFLRLTVTAALDIRAIRDNGLRPAGDER